METLNWNRTEEESGVIPMSSLSNFDRFENRENMTVNAAIFCPEQNKVGQCGTSVKYVTSQSFSALD